MSNRKPPGLEPAEASSLQALLAEEEGAYRRLLRLAVRQNRYLRQQDLVRLEANAAEWRRFLPRAETARASRESYLVGLGERHDIGRSWLSMSRLARNTRGDHGRDLRDGLRVWEETTGELMRQNSLNGMLARFCLGLVDEETAILCRGMTGRDGCYDARGGERKGACAGVIIRKA
ncbi:flagellar protein FlgN [bacterium]|nr:flagellar protein FlgN [bacterium]MBU1074255.1 flagellar protein FlgN [bacterium]MBU1674890.1 flagellar protein FlgN [bacterium]